MKNLIKNIKNTFFKNHSLVKTWLRKEIEIQNSKWNEYGITNVKVNDSKIKTTITITVQRPGLFIGRKRKNINNLENSFKNSFKKSLEIKIKQSKIWE